MTSKYRVLHIGDNIKYNHDVYERFASEFEIIQPTAAERERGEFMRALKERRWGDFHAIFRPFWNTGGEMGRWDAELIPLLPPSVRIMASAGAGYDWADVDIFAQHGACAPNPARRQNRLANSDEKESYTATAPPPPQNQSPT